MSKILIDEATVKLALEALEFFKGLSLSMKEIERAEEAIAALREAREKEALHKLAAESLNEGLRLDDWDKIHCVNHDCDKCKAQQEPVAQWQKRHPHHWEGKWENTNEHDAKWWRDNSQGWEIRPLYTSPQPPAQPEVDLRTQWPMKGWRENKAATTQPPAQPAREWVGLTDEDKAELRREHYPLPLLLMEATEAKLKEKNT